MIEETLPANLIEFLQTRMRDSADAARLLIVIDPGGRLALTETLTQNQRTWQVVRYDENDLAFRKQFNSDARTLVWVTGRFGATEQTTIEVSSIVDVFRQADEIIDCSLTGALGKLVPNETFPLAPTLEHADLIGNHLGAVAQAIPEIRLHLAPRAALDANTVRALVLHALAPRVDIRSFLFQVRAPSTVLRNYVLLAWSEDWDDRGQTLLREQARTASRLDLGELGAWFNAPTVGVARFLYFYRFLTRARVPNVVNQVRGLGVLGFDPEPLEHGLDPVLRLWEQDAAWRKRVIRQAEAGLTFDDIKRAADLVALDDPSLVLEALQFAEAPAFIYELALRLVRVGIAKKHFQSAMQGWRERHPQALQIFDENDTPFVRSAIAISQILDQMGLISTRLSKPLPERKELSDSLNWYVNGGYYDLELAHALAVRALNRLPEDSRKYVESILKKLRENLRSFLDRADHLLGNQVAENWDGFVSSKQLAPNVLWDFIKTPRVQPTDDACLWFMVFDGMRYDTWQRIVKPRLAERFEIKREQAYLSILPSWTYIARTSLMAGQNPDHWRGYTNKFTDAQWLLTSKLFGLTEQNKEEKLRFYSGMESDRTMENFARHVRYPYNVLVFNISDDNLHKERDNVAALNESVKTQLSNILDFMDGLVRANDLVVVSSDHGFMELDADDGIPIPDESRWQRELTGARNPVTYRYIRSEGVPPDMSPTDTFTFEYRGLRDGKFTVPIGRKWFKREGTKNADRYAHGGISFAEMVVPGALLKLIETPRFEFTLEGLPWAFEADEGKALPIPVRVRNKGNQAGEYVLSLKADTDPSIQVLRGALNPGESEEHAPIVKPVARRDGVTTRFLQIALSFQGADGKAIKSAPREIPIKVRERRDVVEISFGGLDDLDKM